MDESGQKSEEKLEQWKQIFEKVLNVQNEVEANVLGDLEDHSETDTPVPQVTREVISRQSRRSRMAEQWERMKLWQRSEEWRSDD